MFVLTLTNTIGSGLPKVRQNSIAQVTKTALVLTSFSHDADANLTTRMERSVLTPGIKFIKLYIPVLELTERNVTRYSLKTPKLNKLIVLFATTISKIFLVTVVQPSRTGYFVALEKLTRLNSSPCSISNLENRYTTFAENGFLLVHIFFIVQ